MRKLENKVIIVTGAFSGIGKEITKLFISHGATVIGTGRNKVNAIKLQKEIKLKYGKDNDDSLFMYHLGDITKNETVKSVVDLTLDKYKKIDIIVNNAGMIDRFNTAHNMTDELWEYILKLNLTAPMKLTREVLPYMIKQKYGIIINIGSLGSVCGARGGVGYVSTKHGLLGLTKNTAQAYGKDGIRSNLIAPSFSLTGILEPHKEIKIRGFKMVLRGIKAGFRLIRKKDIARLALFLANDESKIINGQYIVIDDGWSAY